ncbi:MAG: PAS domain-containing sensor histidine kinase [Neomegalonema sp.]|nr:PAS domain-containing sensor histidine kinase [Neomegalonema sp.]
MTHDDEAGASPSGPERPNTGATGGNQPMATGSTPTAEAGAPSDAHRPTTRNTPKRRADALMTQARNAARSTAAAAAVGVRSAKEAAHRAARAGRSALAAAKSRAAGRKPAGPPPEEQRLPWILRVAPTRPSALLVGALAVAGPILAILTYATLSSADQKTVSSLWFKLLILADICYLVGLMALVGLQIARLVIARRAGSAGSRLHARMVAIFIGVAAAPTVLVAVFFFFIIQLGVNAWFSDQVGFLVRSSGAAAKAYEREVLQATVGQSFAVAKTLNDSVGSVSGPRDPRFARLLDEAASARGFTHVYVLDSKGKILARGLDSFRFNFVPPSKKELATAIGGKPVVRKDVVIGEMRALLRLESFYGAVLYVSRPVDSSVLETRTRTKAVVASYERLEDERDAFMAQFAALYLGFALLVLIAAIYLGLWFAERLARPIGRLAAAAQRVRAGDLVVRVKEERGDDELALLSRVFNRMTEEVQRKQEALKSASAESEQRRLFSEAVLSGVSAGVVGLDADGRIRMMNEPAARLLSLDPEAATGRMLTEAAPEFKQLYQDACYDPANGVEREVRILRDGEELELMARITNQRQARRKHGNGGFVVTLDDVTELVSAQRLAAWGDVARRIAHEIKNPLTPIQLAAERLKRKYRDRLGDENEAFERYTETIVRQTAEIGRMVDAFSRFAKMPTPTIGEESIFEVVRQAITLQEEGRTNIKYAFDASDDAQALHVRVDRGQIHQALTNLLQNAADAIESRVEHDASAGVDGAPAQIRISLARRGNMASITISDNGCGLPARDRRRLLEPYVTTRDKGTGLGLAIVSKIVEEHHGAFELGDAEPFAAHEKPGAAARITLPLSPTTIDKLGDAAGEGRAEQKADAEIAGA